jgi:hypothetical protein
MAVEKLSKGEFSPLSPNSLYCTSQHSGSMSSYQNGSNSNQDYSSIASLSVGDVQFSQTVREHRNKGVGVHIYVSE